MTYISVTDIVGFVNPFKHILQLVILMMVLAFYMIYPFMAGSYDSFAMALSTIIQIFGVFGLLFVPVGIFWLIHEISKQNKRKQNLPYKDKTYSFTLVFIIIFSFVAVILSLVAFALVGKSLGLIAFVLSIYSISKLIRKLRQLKNTSSESFNPLSFYLLFIPTFIVLFQIAFATPLTDYSRSHAIANSAEFIQDIESYYSKNGYYPNSLQAAWKDYYPDVVGIEKFHYAKYEDTYNLFFEQPRFFFDNWGTREFVVYNKQDKHIMLSHTSWILIFTPEQMQTNQGWYEFHDVPNTHWKYFWFD